MRSVNSPGSVTPAGGPRHVAGWHNHRGVPVQPANRVNVVADVGRGAIAIGHALGVRSPGRNSLRQHIRWAVEGMRKGARMGSDVVRRHARRRVCAPIAAAVSIASAVTGHGLVSLIAFSLVIAIALIPDEGADVLAWLPAGLMLALTFVMVAAVYSGVLGLSLWRDGRAGWSWSTLVVLVLLVAVRRGGAVQLWSPSSLVAAGVTLPVAITLGVRLVTPLENLFRPMWVNPDWTSHGEMLVDIRLHGYLDFFAPTPASAPAIDIYPRALHGALAWLGGIGAPSVPADRALWEGALWWLSAASAIFTIAACMSSALLAIRVAHEFVKPASMNTLRVGTLAALATLPFVTSAWLYPFAFSGFVTTAGAAVMIFAIVQVAGDLGGGQAASRLALVSALAAGTFLLWQLLAIPLLPVVAYLLVRWWRSGHPRAIAVALGLLASALVCVPMALVSVNAEAASHVAEPGYFTPIPVWFTIPIAVTALAAGIGWGTTDTLRVVLPMILGALVVLGLTLTGVLPRGLQDLPYYPAKLLWHALVLAFPVALVAAVVAVGRAWAVTVRAGRAVGMPVAAATALLAVLLVPAAAVAGAWSDQARDTAQPSGNQRAVAANEQVFASLFAVFRVLHGHEPSSAAVMPWSMRLDGTPDVKALADWYAVEFARSLGYRTPGKSMIAAQDELDACTFLRDNPAALRITAARDAPSKLLQAGCPQSVVKPELWNVVATRATG
jgi:hypothetical protein